MSNKSVGMFLGLFFAALLAGCVKDVQVKKPAAPINKVALVSLSVSNWGGTVTGTSGSEAKAAALISSTLGSLLEETESKLSGILRVTKVSGFVKNPEYRNLASKSKHDVLVPKASGTPLAIFANDNEELIAAKVSPEVAKKLCTSLNVDAVIVVYSEWAETMGRFVPTRRALAKNVVSVWDRNGDLVFFKRVDEQGEGVLGGPYGPIVVNEGTIKQWAGAYNSGFGQIVQEMKTTLKP